MHPQDKTRRLDMKRPEPEWSMPPPTFYIAAPNQARPPTLALIMSEMERSRVFCVRLDKNRSETYSGREGEAPPLRSDADM